MALWKYHIHNTKNGIFIHIDHINDIAVRGSLRVAEMAIVLRRSAFSRLTGSHDRVYLMITPFMLNCRIHLLRLNSFISVSIDHINDLAVCDSFKVAEIKIPLWRSVHPRLTGGHFRIYVMLTPFIFNRRIQWNSRNTSIFIHIDHINDIAVRGSFKLAKIAIPLWRSVQCRLTAGHFRIYVMLTPPPLIFNCRIQWNSRSTSIFIHIDHINDIAVRSSLKVGYI